MATRSFAPKFKPTFRACDLALFLNNPGEKVELKLLFKYSPFKSYKPKEFEKFSQKETPPVVKELREKDKDFIRKEWQGQLAKGEINFNDQLVISKVNETITISYLNELDDESNETKMIRKMDFSKLENQARTSQPQKGDQEAVFKIDYDIEGESKKEKMTEYLETYKSVAKTTVYMERGNQLEKSIIERLNEQQNYNFVQDKELKWADFELFKICGIPDGIDLERQTVVEVKTRYFIDIAKKSPVCLRERVQCLSYLKLTNCKLCLLVESGPNGEQNVHRIEWDEDEFVSRVVDKLSDFVCKYRRMSEQEFCQIAKKYKYNQIYY
jgi:hypothetical protein